MAQLKRLLRQASVMDKFSEVFYIFPKSGKTIRPIKYIELLEKDIDYRCYVQQTACGAGLYLVTPLNKPITCPPIERDWWEDL